MLIYQNNPPPSCQQRQSFLSLTTKYLLQATSPLSLPSSHSSDSGEAQNETPKSVRCTHLKTILYVFYVFTSSADHGILSGRGIPARRTRAMRTWVLSIVIGYTIICTKIAILALGD